MDRIPSKTNPKLFDKEVLKIQNALASSFSWLDHAIGICETLTDVKEGKKFTSANLYLGDDQYEQIMPCDELGNFSYFSLKDPQETTKNPMVVKSPFSLIIWYDTRKVSLPNDEHNTEQIKGQILELLRSQRFSNFQIDKIYEKPKNIFSEYSYDFTQNQHLMSPYAGMRIDGVVYAKLECPLSETYYLITYDNMYFKTSENNYFCVKH